ncbi:DUF1516 family protein [Fructilactobacillus vespulae]|uniref:DUF1516 family protein n=1 Tax=Fructilactobacillus vespulae TaxID=1249630 RepID=UPI0039B4DC92
MLINLIIFLWILLIVNFIWGIKQTKDKSIVKLMMMGRAIYFLILIGEVILIIRNFTSNPALDLASFSLTVSSISFVDIIYQRKLQGNLKLYLIFIAIFFILVSIISLFLIP